MPLFWLILIFALLGFGVIWERRYQRKRRLALLQQLRTWAGQAMPLEPALRPWIDTLSEEEANVLLELLTGYCNSLNWELTWLFAPDIAKAPLLKQTLETHVIAYAQAILTSLQMAEAARTYQAYVAFINKTNSREQRTLAQKLYPCLCANGLITAEPPPRRRFFRRQAAVKQQMAAIQQAFAQAPEQTMALLQQLLSEETASTLQQYKTATQPSSTPITLPTTV